MNQTCSWKRYPIDRLLVYGLLGDVPDWYHLLAAALILPDNWRASRR